MLFKCLFLVICVASSSYSANILAITATPCYSHQSYFHEFWNQLSLRGHRVTVMTTDPQKNGKMTNLTEIDVSWSYNHFADISSVGEQSSMWNFHPWFLDRSLVITDAQLSDSRMQNLIHDKANHFDVLLLEAFYPEFLGFAELYNCPTILISSFEVFIHVHQRMGNTAHPILYPNLLSSFTTRPMKFKERIVALVYYVYMSFFYNYVGNSARKPVMSKFFNTTSTTNELLDNIDMLFLNVNPILQPARALGPNTIYISGMRRMSAKPLPDDLSKFLDNAGKGFVYFSLGSTVKSKDIKKESIQAIAETLGELPYKVLWKFEANPETLPLKSDNVKLIKWAPQLAILAHRNIKVFVTQGGLQSLEELVNYEVPCVVVPFFTEQQENADIIRNKGIGVVVGRQPHIQKDELKNAILEVINNNKKYKDAVKIIKQLSLDAPMTGLEKAIWWTEYVIRNKGAKHLRNPAADLPLYQHYLLDVVGFLITAAVVTLSISYLLLRKLYNSFAIIFESKSIRFYSINKKSQ